MFIVRPPPQQLQELRMYINGSRYQGSSALGGHRPYHTGDSASGIGYITTFVQNLPQRNQSTALGAMLANIRNHVAAGGSVDLSSSLTINAGLRSGSATDGSRSSSRLLQPYNVAVGAVAGLFLLLTCGILLATVCSLRRKRNVVSVDVSSSTLYMSTVDRRQRVDATALENWELDELSTPPPTTDAACSGACSMSSGSPRLSSLRDNFVDGRRSSSTNTLLVDIDNEPEVLTCVESKTTGSLIDGAAAARCECDRTDSEYKTRRSFGSIVGLSTVDDSSITHV
jgi:hypothetical protein